MMKGILQCSKNTITGLLSKSIRYFAAGRFLLLFIIYSISIEQSVKSQDDLSDYEDISVLVLADGIESFYTDALYSKKGLVFISIESLFNNLKIPCIAGQKGDSLGGFIGNEDRPYSISYPNGEISISNKLTGIKKGLIKQMGMLYMESSLYNQLFGIQLTFSFRSLSLVVKSDFELPVLKALRLEKLRSNIRKNTGETIADTALARTYHMFRFGMLDWSVMSSQIINRSSDTRIGLGIGAELLGGETNIFLNYSGKYNFDKRQQQYLWRWVNNDKKLVKQIQAGKISTQTISSVYYPVIGASVSNTPTSVRRAMGEYIINDVTQPDWFVELYINNVLMDFAKADASGMFRFKVPLVYGFTTLTLRFYGPMGEERSEIRTMNIPYSFLPAGEFEYRISGGLLQDGKHTPFGRGEANLGVNRILTIGAGIEYLASITTGTSIPFVTASFLPMSKLMIKAEYDNGVKSRGLLNYYLWSNSMLEIDYTRYVKDQKAILYNYLEERKTSFSIPLRTKNIAGFARIGFKQNVYSNFNYNMAELLLSSYYKQLNTNISTYANWVNNQSVYINSMAAVSYRMKKGLTLRPSVQVNLSKGQFISYKAEVEKRFAKSAYFAVAYENQILSNYNSLNFTFKYDLSFAQTNASARFSNNEISTSQGARGSISFGSGNKHALASELTAVGRGGITLIPFIDINHNGVYDSGEQMVENLSVKINGGRVIYSKNNPIIRVVGLEPFISYILELSDKDFENIAWRLKNKTYKVLIDPNQFKTIEIPIIPAGEVSGTVYLKKDSIEKGLARILINFYNSKGKKEAQTLSESDGYMNYLGLEPGVYTARIDSVQLSRLNLRSVPGEKPFRIKATRDGDIVDGIDFTLTTEQIDTTTKTVVADSLVNIVSSETIVKKDSVAEPTIPVQTIKPAVPEKPVIRKDTSYMVIHQVTQELVTITEDSYALQLGAFKMKVNADKFRKQLQNLLGKPAEIVIEGDFFKVRITGMKDMKEVDENIAILRQNGVIELWLISLKAKQQQWVLINKKDSVAQVRETIIEKPVHAFSSTIAVQVGAFKQGAKAIELQKRLSATTNKKVEIVPENGFFKVRISGFTSQGEMEKITSSIGLMGSKVWKLPQQKQNETVSVFQPPFEEPIAAEPPAIILPDTAQKVTEEKVEIPEVVKADTIQKIAEEIVEPPVVKPDTSMFKDEEIAVPPSVVRTDTIQKVAEEITEPPVIEVADTLQAAIEEKIEVPSEVRKPVPAEPKISLQVGVVYKHSEALRVQRKIISKLKLPVEVVKQWDYYRVVITGFYTREETYKFYPELVGLGYPKIYMIEKK